MQSFLLLKAIIITYFEYVVLALIIQYEMCKPHILFYAFYGPTMLLYIIW
jgi:hypothetical protein